MEPSFTLLRRSKKKKQNRRLERGVPIKRRCHFCCSTCVADGTYSPICRILKDKNEDCFCQQARDIKEDALGIVGEENLVCMQRVHATPHGNESVTYDKVSFTGEMQRCTVCCTEMGHRYLGTIDCDSGEMVRSHTGEMMLMRGGPIERYFLLDRKRLKIVKVTFNANQLGEN